MTSVLFTDGSSSLRSGKCGWAVIGRFPCPLCQRAGGAFADCRACNGYGVREIKRCGFGDGSNQLAELIALVYAMRLAPKDSPTIIVSDSEYSIKSVTFWRKRWETSSPPYTNYMGKPIAYAELVKYSHRLHDEKPLITFQHVRGHTGVEGNELADALCRSARYVAEGREPLANLGDMLVREF